MSEYSEKGGENSTDSRRRVTVPNSETKPERGEKFEDIHIIGFDLDQTLYPRSTEIDDAIQAYLYQKIANHYRCNIEEAADMFRELYQGGEGLSGRKTLIHLGLPEAKTLIQEALENAEIENILKPEETTTRLLNNLSAHYTLDLVTGSQRSVAFKKLRSLDIEPALFNAIITSDYAAVGGAVCEMHNDFNKSSGEAYEYWLSLYPEVLPGQVLYVGDRPKIDHEIPKSFGIQTALVNIQEVSSQYSCLQLSSFGELERYL